MNYKKPEKNKSRLPVAFNMAAHHAQYIHNTLQNSMKYYFNGDIGKWYWRLKGIRILIFHELSEDEIADLKKLEKSCNEGTKSWNKFRSAKEQGLDAETKKYVTNIKEFSNTVEKYAETIMILLNDQGYFPKKEDDTEI